MSNNQFVYFGSSLDTSNSASTLRRFSRVLARDFWERGGSTTHCSLQSGMRTGADLKSGRLCIVADVHSSALSSPCKEINFDRQ